MLLELEIFDTKVLDEKKDVYYVPFEFVSNNIPTLLLTFCLFHTLTTFIIYRLTYPFDFKKLFPTVTNFFILVLEPTFVRIAEFKERDLCGAYYDDLVGRDFEGSLLRPFDRCPNLDCQFKNSKHEKKKGYH